jgi:hypothetical protein
VIPSGQIIPDASTASPRLENQATTAAFTGSTCNKISASESIYDSLKTKIMKNLFCPLLIAACLAWLSTGCATNELPKPEISVLSPKVDLSGLKKYYVARDDESGTQDEKHLRGLHAMQEALTDHGMPATSGLLSAMPADTDCKVIIHDKWFWDVQWYLLSLDISFYDARSNALLASGHDRRALPAIRRDPEFMANELIETILPAPGGTKNP